MRVFGPTYRYLYPSAYVSVYVEAMWVWGHAPPGKFFEFNAVHEMAPEDILGPKTSLLFIAFVLATSRLQACFIREMWFVDYPCMEVL